MPLFQLRLTIGGTPVLVESSRKGFVGNLASKYRYFLAHNDSGHSFRISLSHKPLVNRDVQIHFTQTNGGCVLRGDSFNGTIDVRKNRAAITIPANVSVFDSFLRILYSVLLLSHKGFLVHSLGLAQNGKGHLFPGPSSSGKTTTAKEAEGFQVLSDELVIVKKIGNGFYLFATPFVGEFKRNVSDARAPLEKIFFLSRNSTTPYKRQSVLQTVIHLLENIFFFAQDVQSNQTVLTLCHELSSQITGYEINISACKDFGRFINETA